MLHSNFARPRWQNETRGHHKCDYKSVLLSTGKFTINFTPLNKHCLEVFADVLPGDPNLRILSSVLSMESESRAETCVL